MCEDPPPRLLDAALVGLLLYAAAVLWRGWTGWPGPKMHAGGAVRLSSAAATVLHASAAIGLLRGRGTAHAVVRVCVGAVATVVVASHPGGRRPYRAAAAVAHLAAVATALGKHAQCHDPTPLTWAADLSVLPLTVVLVWEAAPPPALPTKFMLTFFGYEAVAIAAALVRTDVPDKASHLTWWLLGTLAAYDWARVTEGVASMPAPAAAVHPFLLVLSSVVLFGVLLMSVARCALLDNALRDAKAPTYIAGNFAMHYYPLLRALAAWPHRHRAVQPNVLGLKAAALVAIYALAYDPVAEYGCLTLPDSSVAPLALTAIAIAISLGLTTWSSRWSSTAST